LATDLLPSTGAPDRSLFVHYRRTDDPSARRELIVRHLPLARRLARRYGRSHDAEDLVQVASLALVKAVDRYDPAHGASFASFAVPTIVGELKRHFRDSHWALHVARELQERAQVVERELDSQAARRGRAPSTRELAVALGWSNESVLEAQAALGGRDAKSLDAPSGHGDGSEAIRDRLSVSEHGYELVDDRDAVAPALAALSERDRTVLRLRFVEDMTQREIAARVGLSQMQVSRLIRRALEELREATQAEPASPAPPRSARAGGAASPVDRRAAAMCRHRHVSAGRVRRAPSGRS
jgi:RNA polymerase sigma-B factor